MLWADAVYVRNFQNFDNLSGLQLLKIATILHIQYQSVDLALFALARYDAKNGTNVAFRYLENLTGGGLNADISTLLANMSHPEYRPQP